MIYRMAKRAMYSARTPPFGYFHFAILSKAAIKAIYARRFVQMIQFSNEPKSVQSLAGQLKKKQEESENKSLKDWLLSYDINKDLQKLQVFSRPNDEDLSAAKEQMHAYFKGGIHLNNTIFTQDRFTNVRNTMSLYEFFPTYLVTGQVFTFLNQKEDRILIYGRKGISKSSAIALKSLLEGEICAFRIQQTQKKSSLTEDDVKAYKELDKIISNKDVKKILMASPSKVCDQKMLRDVKYFYWNIQPMIDLDYTDEGIIGYTTKLIQSLLDQCRDLPPQFIQNLTKEIKQRQRQRQMIKISLVADKTQNLKFLGFCNSLVGQFVRKIKSRLNDQDKINTVLIVDQINTIFSLVRQVNNIALIKNQQQFQKQKETWEINKKIVKFLNTMLRTVMQLSSNQVIFNSSINIEDEYRKSTFVKNNPRQVSVHIEKRDSIKRSLVRFSESKMKQFWIKEMKQFFYFEIKRQIRIVDQANMIKLANFIFSLRPNKLFTPLLLRELVTQNYSLFKNKLGKLNQDLEVEEHQIKFIQNDRKHHLKFLQNISEEAFKSNLRFLMAVLMNYSFQLNNSTISIAAKIIIDKNKIEQLQKMLNREYFELVKDEKDNYVVETSFNFDDILYFYNAVRSRSQDKPLSETDITNFINNLSEFLNLSGSLLGIILQHWMIKALTSVNSTKLKIYGTQVIKGETFNINSYAVVPNLTKVKNLLQVTGQIESIPRQTCKLFVPTLKQLYEKSVYQEIEKQEMIESLSPNSKGIDFMIIKKQGIAKYKNRYIFNMFQLAVQKASLNSKIKKALAFIGDLQDFDINQIKMHNKAAGSYQINLFIIHNSQEREKYVDHSQFARIIQYVKDPIQKEKVKSFYSNHKLRIYEVYVQNLQIQPDYTNQGLVYKTLLKKL